MGFIFLSFSFSINSFSFLPYLVKHPQFLINLFKGQSVGKYFVLRFAWLNLQSFPNFRVKGNKQKFWIIIHLVINPLAFGTTSLIFLEKEMATHSSTLAWKIPWTEKPGRLQSVGSQRVGHDWATSLHFTSSFIQHLLYAKNSFQVIYINSFTWLSHTLKWRVSVSILEWEN